MGPVKGQGISLQIKVDLKLQNFLIAPLPDKLGLDAIDEKFGMISEAETESDVVKIWDICSIYL